MVQSLDSLKKEFAQKKLKRNSYSIGKLPDFEGHCIVEDGGSFQVFYYERGGKFELAQYSDLGAAIKDFKTRIHNDPFTRR